MMHFDLEQLFDFYDELQWEPWTKGSEAIFKFCDNLNLNPARLYWALDIAADHHEDQVRKGLAENGATIKYLAHPVALMRAAMSIKALESILDSLEREDLFCALLLHDVLEDSPKDDRFAQVAQLGPSVFTLVYLLTAPDKAVRLKLGTRPFRKEVQNRLILGNSKAIFCKLLDRSHNVLFSKDDPFFKIPSGGYITETFALLNLIRSVKLTDDLFVKCCLPLADSLERVISP